MRVRPLALAAVLAIGIASGLVVAAPATAAETGAGAGAEADVPTPVADIAIVMPLTVPLTDPAVAYSDPKLIPSGTPTLIDAETLAYYTSPTGILTTELDAVHDSAVTIGIDPLIIASIRALGSSAPDSARAWLTRLSLATNDTFALSWADSDLTGPLQAGRRHVVRPTSLDFAIDPTLFSTASTASPDPDATPDANSTEAPPLPSSDELTAWHYTLPSIAWPRADTVAAKDFATIAGAYDTTLLSSTNLTRTEVNSATATLGSRPAVVTDAPLSLLVSSALTATDIDGWDSAVAAVTSSITATAARAPADQTASLVIALDREAQLPSSRLTATVAAIAALPAARLVGLGGIAGASASPAALIDERQSGTRLARMKTLLAEESIDARFAAVAADPTLITGERRIRLLNTLSPSAERQAGGWGAATSEYLTDSTTLLQSVKLERSSGLLLLGDSESIRPAVTNDLNQPVTVRIHVRSLSPNLKVVESTVDLTIEPNYQRKASVPVQAISNGRARLALSLGTVAGTDIGSTEIVPINVQAGWEGPFTLIGGIVVVLIFAAGILRTVLRRRKARATSGG